MTRMLWGGFSVVIQELLSLIDSKRKRYKLYSCFFLFSLWTKWPRMNVLQTPGFQYCVYFDGLSPALCNFRGLCVWLVSCDCALSRRNLQSPAYLDIHSYTSRLYRLYGPLGPNWPSKGWWKKRSSKTSGPTIVLAPKLPKQSRYLVLFVFTWSSTQLKQLTTISSTIHWFTSGLDHACSDSTKGAFTYSDMMHCWIELWGSVALTSCTEELGNFTKRASKYSRTRNISF